MGLKALSLCLALGVGQPELLPLLFKAQGWRAVAVFDDRPEALLFVGRSSTQIRQEYVEAYLSAVEHEEWEVFSRIKLAEGGSLKKYYPLNDEGWAEYEEWRKAQP